MKNLYLIMDVHAKGIFFIRRSNFNGFTSKLSWGCLKIGMHIFMIIYMIQIQTYENEPFQYLQLLTESQYVGKYCL